MRVLPCLRRNNIQHTTEMPQTCVAFGCSLRSGTNELSLVKFYRFHKSLERKNRWVQAVKRRDWNPTTHSRVCSKHFVTNKQKKIVDKTYGQFKFHKCERKNKETRHISRKKNVWLSRPTLPGCNFSWGDHIFI